MADASAVTVCWGPECGATIEQRVMGRPKLYCSPTCRTRAHRRGGGKSPTEPYPPLEPGVPFKAVGFGRPPKPKPAKAPHLTQDAAEATVVSGPVQTQGKAEAPDRQTPPGAAAPVSTDAGAAPPPDPEPGSADPIPADVDALTGTLAADPPRATVTQLHLAVTEDSTVPVEIKVHPMVAAYRADLDRMQMTETRKGQQVLTMAEKLVSSATSPAAAANLSRELERLMDALVQASPENQVMQDPSVAIRERTIAKLRAVQGGQSERAG